MVLDTIIWENKETFGCEYAKVHRDTNKIIAEGTVVYIEESIPFKVDYEICLDNEWSTRAVTVILNNQEKVLEITASGTGTWLNSEGREIPQLFGAIDVDLSVTPFSNSLPINRYDWQPLQKRDFEMVYVSAPSLTVQKIPQSYTYLKKTGDTRVFAYKSGQFESLVNVDDKGFVVEYPGYFIKRS